METCLFCLPRLTLSMGLNIAKPDIDANGANRANSPTSIYSHSYLPEVVCNVNANLSLHITTVQ